MRLPIVYANTAVRVLEIAGANVASLIVIITSSVVIELDLIFLTALKTDRKARKRRLAPSPPPLPPPPSTVSRVFFLFFSFFFPIISWNIFTVLPFSHLCHSITKISFPFICVRRCYRFFQPASFGHLESKLIGWLLERMYLFWRNLKIWILNVQDFKNSKI